MQPAAFDGSVESSEEEALVSEGQNRVAGVLHASIHHHLTLFWTEVCGQTDVVRRRLGQERRQDEEGRTQVCRI